MEQRAIAIEIRNAVGKSQARSMRRSGKLPGVIYGLGKNCSIAVEPKTIYDLLLKEGGGTQLLNLTGGGFDGKHAIIKDYQIDPLTRHLVHVDLLEIDVAKKILVTIPLSFVGKSVGVAEGGVLNIVERNVEVRCLPTRIPAHIDVDVTQLKIGDSIHLSDVTLAEGIEKVSQTNPTLVTVVPPTKEEEAVASLAPTAEPEVITAKKEAEGEEGKAEGGDKAAAGEGAKEKKEEKKK